MTLTTAAVDASYSVNGSMFTSPTNDAVPITAGINIDLNQVGSVTISQNVPPTQLVSNAQGLVSYINNFIQGIGQVQSSLGANDSTGQCNQLVNALTQIGFQNVNGSNAITTLSDIGIDIQPDGTAQFDQTTFTNAYGNDPTDTSFVLSQASLAYANVANQYCGSNGTVQDQLNELNQLQVALVYGAQADATAAQGSASSRTSPYGATSNPWAGTNFYQG